jgi:hypothetical protein
MPFALVPVLRKAAKDYGTVITDKTRVAQEREKGKEGEGLTEE